MLGIAIPELVTLSYLLDTDPDCASPSGLVAAAAADVVGHYNDPVRRASDSQPFKPTLADGITLPPSSVMPVDGRMWTSLWSGPGPGGWLLPGPWRWISPESPCWCWNRGLPMLIRRQELFFLCLHGLHALFPCLQPRVTHSPCTHCLIDDVQDVKYVADWYAACSNRQVTRQWMTTPSPMVANRSLPITCGILFGGSTQVGTACDFLSAPASFLNPLTRCAASTPRSTTQGNGAAVPPWTTTGAPRGPEKPSTMPLPALRGW